MGTSSSSRSVYCYLVIVTTSIFHVQLLLGIGNGNGNAEVLIKIVPSTETAVQLELKSCKIDKIYQLGDSISDTGNLIREFPVGASSSFSRLPYGQDLHNHHPTGRCSNGLLMIDYIALAAGLPLLNPWEKKDANFSHGVNFAVAGSTALPVHLLQLENISSPNTNSSLDVQLHWMSSHLNSLCFTYQDCAEKLKHALFIVGELGGNDYNFALLQGKAIEEVFIEMVPEVVQAIKEAARRVVQFGGARLVIPGNFPVGCFPFYLASFGTANAYAYDEYDCLKDYNNLSRYHNNCLQQVITELKQEFPNVTIVYADNYNAFQWIFQNPLHLGFDKQSTTKACCGGGGEYNFDPSKLCGTPEASVCADPSERISWDGIHLTQSAYQFMAKWLLASIIPQLQCLDYSSLYLSSS